MYPLSFLLKDIQLFMNPVLTLFLLLFPFPIHISDTSPSTRPLVEKRAVLQTTNKRLPIRGLPKLGRTTYRDTKGAPQSQACFTQTSRLIYDFESEVISAQHLYQRQNCSITRLSAGRLQQQQPQQQQTTTQQPNRGKLLHDLTLPDGCHPSHLPPATYPTLHPGITIEELCHQLQALISLELEQEEEL